jgi:NAD-dependent dihydropyrimidine dehydrogenase PreA subunit
MPKVTVDYSKCDGDGTCVSVCPVSVYEIQKKPEFNNDPRAVPVNADACIVCRACETQCPTQAIKIEE